MIKKSRNCSGKDALAATEPACVSGVNLELKHLSKETYEGFSETQEICQISLENPSLCFSHLIQELAYNYTLFSRMSAQAPTKVFSTGNYS